MNVDDKGDVKSFEEQAQGSWVEFYKELGRTDDEAQVAAGRMMDAYRGSLNESEGLDLVGKVGGVGSKRDGSVLNDYDSACKELVEAYMGLGMTHFEAVGLMEDTRAIYEKSLHQESGILGNDEYQDLGGRVDSSKLGDDISGVIQMANDERFSRLTAEYIAKISKKEE